MATTLIALGSNLGDRAGGIDGAIERLSQEPGVRLVKVATTLETQPIGVPDSDATFFNSAARFEVDLSAREWLDRLLETERELGRSRSVRWGARRIDLDLLLYDDLITDSRPLRVPHPRMGFRRFVMQPAVEIGGDLRHPVCDATLAELAQHLDHAANWVWWPASQASTELISKLAPKVAWRSLTSAADMSDWRAAAEWLRQGTIAGDQARVVVTQTWPMRIDRESMGMPDYPKLAIRAVQSPFAGDVDPFEELLRQILRDSGLAQASDSFIPKSIEPPIVKPIRLQLPLESEDPAEIRRDVEAALEAMTSV